MTKSKEPIREKPALPHEYWPLAGFLSYLVPGLGQIYQGRIGKGVLFLICIPSLFFLGMALGDWKNVYLPDDSKLPKASIRNVPLEGVEKALYYRLPYLGQFWVGVAAWPALLQYWSGTDEKEKHGLLGNFERAPSERTLNQLQSNGDKSWDLGWVYTVIAGVLNILVIYDAVAGPFYIMEKEEGPVPETSPS